MADLLQLSARDVDEGVWEGPGALRPRRALYRARRREELSLMARGTYGTAARESAARVEAASPGRPPEA